MLIKNPRPAHRRWLATAGKVLFVAEAVAFAVSYGVWNRLNSNRDFRLYMHINHDWVLEGYYKIGETLGQDTRARESDLKVWRQEGKL